MQLDVLQATLESDMLIGDPFNSSTIYFSNNFQMLLGELRVKTDERQKLIVEQKERKKVPPPTAPKRYSYGVPVAAAALNGAATERAQIPTKKSRIEEVRIYLF